MAAIDVGTNSIHMIVAEARGSGYRIIDREKEMVQLGRGSLGGSPLTPEAIQRGVVSLSRMAQIAERWNVSEIVCVATSALREAPNRDRFLSAVKEQSGIGIRVISGEEEADLIYKAVRSEVDFQNGAALCIDIGGGSVELIVGTETEIYYAASLPLGSLRMAQRFFSAPSSNGRALRECTEHVEKKMRKPLDAIRSLGFDFTIGTSGTIFTLAEIADAPRMAKTYASLRWLTRDALQRVLGELDGVPPGERAALFGLDERRAETILAGGVVLSTIMEALRIRRLRACSAALREGLVETWLEEHGTARKPSTGVRRAAVLELADRTSVDFRHASHVARLALRLFDETASLHGLGSADRELLEHAAILHEVGMHVGFRGYQKHSYYLIRHATLRGFTDDQVALIANIARYHRKATPEETDDNVQELSPEQRSVLEKLVAILRLADALDRGRRQTIRDVVIDSQGSGAIQVRLTANGDSGVEFDAARKRAKHFSRLFGRKVEICGEDPHPVLPGTEEDDE